MYCFQAATHSPCCDSDEDLLENAPKLGNGELLDVEDLGKVLADAKTTKVCSLLW